MRLRNWSSASRTHPTNERHPGVFTLQRPVGGGLHPLKGVDKGSGVARMGEMLGGGADGRWSAWGTATTTCPMFGVCGLSIAMGGAPARHPERSPTLVVPTVEEDGLAFAIDNYILPRVG